VHQRTEAECVAHQDQGTSGPGVRLFIPAEDLPELFEALELAADRGDFMRVDHLLVTLDRVIQDASKAGQPWAQAVMARLDEGTPVPASALAGA
jgi:hypothetical protein